MATYRHEGRCEGTPTNRPPEEEHIIHVFVADHRPHIIDKPLNTIQPGDSYAFRKGVDKIRESCAVTV